MKLGEILIVAGVVDEAAIARGRSHGDATAQRLGSALVDLGLVSAEAVAVALARQHRVPPAREAHLASADASCAALVPARVAREACAVPLGLLADGREIAVALADPGDVGALDALAFASGKRVRPAVACQRRLRQRIDELYGAAPLEPRPGPVGPGELELVPLPPPGAAGPGLPAHLAAAAAAAPPPAVIVVPAAPARPARSSPALGAVIGIAVAAVSSTMTYRWCSARSRGDAVAGRVANGHTGLSLELPATGWYHLPRENATQDQDGMTMRAAVFYRGADPDLPDVGLMLGNLRPPVPFPADITDEQFEQIMRGMERAPMLGQSFKVDGLRCDFSDRRPGQLAECEGTGQFKDHALQVTFYLWVGGPNAAVLAGFITPRDRLEMRPDIDQILPTIEVIE